jgi:hypothetical protein
LTEGEVCLIFGRRMAGRDEAFEEAEAMCSERMVLLKAMHALEYLSVPLSRRRGEEDA